MTLHDVPHKSSSIRNVEEPLRVTPSAQPQSVARLMMLQQTIGNQAVQRLLMKTPQTGVPRIQRGVLNVATGIQGETAQLTYSDSNTAYIPLGGLYPGQIVRGRLLIMVHVSQGARGHGHATTLINNFLAQFGGEQCYLEVMPSDDQPMNAGQLSTWYGNHGWFDTGMVNDTGHMIMTNNLLGIVRQPMPQDDDTDSSSEDDDPGGNNKRERDDDDDSEDEDSSSSNDQLTKKQRPDSIVSTGSLVDSGYNSD